MSESAPSIDPKTLAIGAAVVVAGVGAYMLLSEKSGSGTGSGSDSSNPVTGIIAGATDPGGVLGGDDDCPLPDTVGGSVTKFMETNKFAKFCMGLGIGWAAKKITMLIQDIPSMDELNKTRSDAFATGKAAIAKGDYTSASQQYSLLLLLEDKVLQNREASFGTSHTPDPFCKNPLSAQLLELMHPLIIDYLTKQYTAMLDTAEANIDAGHYAVARANLGTFSYMFDKLWTSGGGSTEAFMAPIKKRRDSLMSDIEAGEARLMQSKATDLVVAALRDPTYARFLSGDLLKAYNTILPVYQQYLTKKDDPDLDVRVAVAKAILQLPNWYANTPEMQAFISKTSAEFNAQASDQKKALAGVAAAASTIGAGLEHLLGNQDSQASAWRATVDLYFRWTPAQQKQFVDSLSPDDKKLFMNAIRQAKMDRVNNRT